MSQHKQFPTRSANQFPSCLESCKWSIISVFVCCRPCTVLSTLQEDGTIELPPIFERWEVQNLSRNLACGLSETKTASFMLCLIHVVTSCWRAVTLHLENKSLIASIISMNGELGSHECSHNAAPESHKPTTNTPEDVTQLRSVSQNTRKKCRSPNCHHIDAETENPKSLHLSCLNFEP